MSLSFISREIAWPPWKFGVLKFSMVTFGILMGAYFSEFWLSWQLALWGVFAVTATATTVWGIQATFGAPRRATKS